MFFRLPSVTRFIAFLLLLSFVATSCRSREVAYLSDARRDTAQQILHTHSQLIMPGDQLYIHVASQISESVIPFNQETHNLLLSQNSVGTEKQGNEVKYVSVDISGYFVGDDGTITFPILGKLLVAGLTQDSLCHYIEGLLKDREFVLDPMVTSRLMNFRVTVVGEVAKPQQIHVPGTRLTILEALAICGDLTMDGRRDNVAVMRQENGVQTIAELDLTKSDFLESPYYYLQQNDIVYVEPVKKKQRISDRDENIPKYISIGVNVWSIIRTNINTVRQINNM